MDRRAVAPPDRSQRPQAPGLRLTIENLRLTLPASHGPVDILRGVDLAVEPGTAVGLVGPSGSGKTSLLMLLAGLEVPTAGRVMLDETDIATLGEDARARLRRDDVGIVFQNFHLIPTMTAWENVAVPLELAGVRTARTQALAALGAVGLSHRSDHRPGQLSGGEQQRVALARAIVARPRLLLADEPTGNLDGETGELVMAQLFALQRSRGATMLLVTHDKGLAARCDRVVTLVDGRVT